MVLWFFDKTSLVLQVVLWFFDKTPLVLQAVPNSLRKPPRLCFDYLGIGSAYSVPGISSVRCLGRFIMSKNALIENALTLGHN